MPKCKNNFFKKECAYFLACKQDDYESTCFICFSQMHPFYKISCNRNKEHPTLGTFRIFCQFLTSKVHSLKTCCHTTQNDLKGTLYAKFQLLIFVVKVLNSQPQDAFMTCVFFAAWLICFFVTNFSLCCLLLVRLGY